MFNRKQIRPSTCESASIREQFWRAYSVNDSGSMMFTQRMLSWRTKWSQVERPGELRTELPSKPLMSTFNAHYYLLLPFAQIRSRVHISDKTLSFLNGEFEVEPAFGEKREEALRIAGLKTYFITKVLKPVRDFLLNIKSLVHT